MLRTLLNLNLNYWRLRIHRCVAACRLRLRRVAPSCQREEGD
jgi:hypothetical protein